MSASPNLPTEILNRKPTGCNCKSYLQLLQRESSTSSSTAVVLQRRTSHNRSELIDRSWSNSSRLGQTSSSASRLAAGLIEVHADTTLPVLVEVVVGELLIVLDRHCDDIDKLVVMGGGTTVRSRQRQYEAATEFGVGSENEKMAWRVVRLCACDFAPASPDFRSALFHFRLTLNYLRIIAGSQESAMYFADHGTEAEKILH